jgi:hypothetical protein
MNSSKAGMIANAVVLCTKDMVLGDPSGWRGYSVGTMAE